MLKQLLAKPIKQMLFLKHDWELVYLTLTTVLTRATWRQCIWIWASVYTRSSKSITMSIFTSCWTTNIAMWWILVLVTTCVKMIGDFIMIENSYGNFIKKITHIHTHYFDFTKFYSDDRIAIVFTLRGVSITSFIEEHYTLSNIIHGDVLYHRRTTIFWVVVINKMYMIITRIFIAICVDGESSWSVKSCEEEELIKI